MSEITKVLTENPLLDEIVYNCKIMMQDTILKDEEAAINEETVSSIKSSDLYILSYEKKSRFEDYYFDKKFLSQCSYIPSYVLNQFADDNNSIPQSFRDRLTADMQNYYVKNYIEENNYYRKLNGLPPFEEKGILISDIDFSKINSEDFYIDPKYKYLHELDDVTIDIISNFGIIEQLKKKYPKSKYLKFLGSNKISIYEARKARKFDILRVPMSNIEVYNRYTYFLTANKNYFLKRVYSEAYKFLSTNYDKVLMILIIITSFLDCIAELPEYYVRNDIFDMRTVKYIFESKGVKFFEDIPLKYQIRMIKNLNYLVKYKSTNKCIIDICSIFGFDNIEIFKYYLLRDRIVDNNGKYKTITKINDNGEEEEDVIRNYGLKFIKVPFDSEYDKYIKDKINIMEYDDVVSGDPKWDGPYSHEEIRNNILRKEFNVELSKYISIDTLYELTEMTFDLPYFINMVMFSNIKDDPLTLYITQISPTESFKMTDLFIYLYALMHRYIGVEDKIFYEKSEILSVMGFNFEADLGELSNYLIENNLTMESLGIDKFDTAANGIYSFAQLMSIFIENKNAYNIVRNGMINAQTKKQYDIFKKIYDTLFISKLNFDYYQIPLDINEKENYTYTKFLEIKNTTLFQSLDDIDHIIDQKTKATKISALMGAIVSKMEEVLNSDLIDNIFINIPTVSVDYVKNYMFEVINFFKSFKVQLLDINTIYKFDDKLNNRIFFIDDVYKLTYMHTYADNGKIREKIYYNTTLNSEERDFIKEKIYILSEYMKQYGLSEDATYKDLINKLTVIMEKSEDIIIDDKIDTFTVTVTKNDLVVIYEEMAELIAHFLYSDLIKPADTVAAIIRVFTKIFSHAINIFDDIKVHVFKTLEDYVNYQYKNSGISENELHGIKEKIYEYKYVFDKIECIPHDDKFTDWSIFKIIRDKYRIKEGFYITRTSE